MTFEEMIQEVKNIIQDDTFDSDVPGYVNEAFLQASGRVNIPDLKRIGIATTVTDQMFTQLRGIDGGFGGRLSKLVNSEILRFRDIESLVTWVVDSGRSLDETGSIEAVALEGGTLWYFPTPAVEENIQCVLFSNPTKMENDTDEPSEFPEICHRNIGIHGAAFLAYQIIEDGIDGDKVNSTHHFTMFEKGITQLVEYIGRHRVHHISSSSYETTVATQDSNSFISNWRNPNAI